MVSGRPVFKLLALSVVLALVLVACVRPLSQSDDAVAAEATATAEAEAALGAGEGPSEEGASGESATEEGASEDVSSEEGPSDEAASSEEEASAGEAEEGGAEDSGAAGATEEDTSSSEDEVTEGSADEAESGDENVGGGAPDTAEGETAEEVDEAAAAEEPADEAAAPVTGTESTTSLPATHTVAAGENLYRIGLKYGMSWVVLAQYNHLPNANRIYVGQVLQIPGGQPPPSQPPPQAPEYTSYVVKPGDNLFRIGLAYGVSWVDIAAANGIVNPNVIYPGQVLKIPTNSPGQAPQLTHTVQRGETLFRISLRYGVSWIAIAQANNISSPYVIYPGQTLIIPSG
jgi:LysM repeat protein